MAEFDNNLCVVKYIYKVENFLLRDLYLIFLAYFKCFCSSTKNNFQTQFPHLYPHSLFNNVVNNNTT